LTDEERLDSLQRAVGYTFRKPSLALDALTHSSWRGEHPGATDNQRLEFLGDAVLQLVCAAYLYARDSSGEGVLTRLRSALVCQVALAQYAEELGLRELMRVGGSTEELTEGQLSDTYEAVLAAVYLDGGICAATKFATASIDAHIEEAAGRIIDEKSALQEYLAGKRMPAPVYQCGYAEGPSHKPTYEAAVYIGNRVMGIGRGASKKAAEKAAAGAALKATALTLQNGE